MDDDHCMVRVGRVRWVRGVSTQDWIEESEVEEHPRPLVASWILIV